MPLVFSPGVKSLSLGNSDTKVGDCTGKCCRQTNGLVRKSQYWVQMKFCRANVLLCWNSLPSISTSYLLTLSANCKYSSIWLMRMMGHEDNGWWGRWLMIMMVDEDDGWLGWWLMRMMVDEDDVWWGWCVMRMMRDEDDAWWGWCLMRMMIDEDDGLCVCVCALL